MSEDDKHFPKVQGIQCWFADDADYRANLRKNKRLARGTGSYPRCWNELRDDLMMLMY